MTIVYLTNQYPYAGSTFIRREIAAIEAMGFHVARFSIRLSGTGDIDPADVLERAATRCILAQGIWRILVSLAVVAFRRPGGMWRAVRLVTRIGWRSDRGLARYLVYLAEACVCLRWCQEMRVDHMHVHMGTNPATVAMLCRVLGGPPYSFTAHGVETFDAPAFIAVKEKVAMSAFTVGVCDYGRSQLCRWSAPEHWGKIHVIRCGVDDAFLTHPPLPVPVDARLVCVARLSPEKGHMVLLEAAGQLVRQGFCFELLLVGDGPMRPLIEQRVEQLGLSGVVQLLGWRSGEGVREVIGRAKALLLTSFAEGLPVVIMEALALGRPVISTWVSGVPELVQPGVTGWLVPPGSVDQLAAAMREALTAPAERLGMMGRAGAAIVAERHNAATEAARLAELFRDSVVGRGIGEPHAASSALDAMPV